MIDVKVAESVNATAASVWELIRDFGGIAKWAGSALQGCTVEGTGIGAVRTITVPGGGQIRERLEQHDDAKRTFSYAILPPCPLPLRDYLATVTVLDEGAGRARIEWESRFEPAGVAEAQARSLVEGIYRGGIAGIRKTLGG